MLCYADSLGGEQYDEFMKLVCECYFCSDVVVQDFLEMLRESKLEAVDIECFVEDDFDDVDELLQYLVRGCI